MKHFVACIVVFMTCAGTLCAQTSLTGFHIGALAGYAEGAYESGTTPGIDHEPSGGYWGGQIGWSGSFGSLIAGVDADLAFTSLEGDDNVTVSGFRSDLSSEVNYLGTLRGRLGWMAGNAMIYGTAGLAIADLDNHIVVSSAAGAAVGRDTEGSQHTGWVAGAGVEFPITPKISFDAEYLYIDMGDEDVTVNIGAFPFTDTADLNLSTVRVGINFRF